MRSRILNSLSRLVPAGVGLGLVLTAPAVGRGQAPPPLPEGAVAQARPGDVPTARQLAGDVRRLSDDIATDRGQEPNGAHLMEDARELAQSLEEFRQDQREGAGLTQARHNYSGLHASWMHIRAHLVRPGVTTPAIERDVQRIDALEAQLGQSLGLNPLPQDYYAAAPNAPGGTAQVRRLARALVDRAEALALTIQGEIPNDPRAQAVVNDAQQLAREADVWHDGLIANNSQAAAARAFGPVDELGDRIEQFVTTQQVPPRVAASWQAFASVEVLIHRELGLASPQPTVAIQFPPVNPPIVQPNPVVVPAPAPVPVQVVESPIVGLSHQLVDQVGAFTQDFRRNGSAVPQGGAILVDAERLLAAATSFRESVARGVDPNSLAYAFRDLDATWIRLARRVNRIANGRNGPGVQKVSQIGETCEQIHRALGMPGFAPVFGPN